MLSAVEEPHLRGEITVYSWSPLQMLKHQCRIRYMHPPCLSNWQQGPKWSVFTMKPYCFGGRSQKSLITHMAWLLQTWIRSVVGTALDSLLKLVKSQLLSFKTWDIGICISTGFPADNAHNDFKYCLCVWKLEIKLHKRSMWKGEPGPQGSPVTEPQSPFPSSEFQTFTYTCFLNGFPCLHVSLSRLSSNYCQFYYYYYYYKES